VELPWWGGDTDKGVRWLSACGLKMHVASLRFSEGGRFPIGSKAGWDALVAIMR
jgi:hypothetical protein